MEASNINPYNYGRSLNNRYVLSQDKIVIMRGREDECWKYIHRYTPHSVAYALEYGGYTITPEENTTFDGG